MGRHGGGSRNRGRSGGRSGGGSRNSGVRSSAQPFSGCYNRSYYHKGKYHSYYTADKDFSQTKSMIGVRVCLIVVWSVLLLPMMVSMTASGIIIGEKVNGNPDRIVIQDTIDLLTPGEEQKLLTLFDTVYAKSGMPVTLYTDDMEWKDKYSSIEVYSEEVYYGMGTEENAMIILFTYDGTFDWVYDIYCGDDTIKCLSDSSFDTLIDNLQKGMAGQNLCDALEFSFNSIMGDLAETYVDTNAFLAAGMGIAFYCLFVGIMYCSCAKDWKAYKYFKENRNQMDDTPMSVKYECSSCGAHNTNLSEVCEYCGTVLKL